MAITVSLNGVEYQIPTMGESANWGTSLNEYLVALAAAVEAASAGGGGDGGVVSLGAPYVGSDSQGAAIAGSVLSLQLANAAGPGLMSAADKTKLDAAQDTGTTTLTSTTFDTTPILVPLGLVVPEATAILIQAQVLATQGGTMNTISVGLAGTFLANALGVEIISTTGLWDHRVENSATAAFHVAGSIISMELTGLGQSLDWVINFQYTMLAPGT